VFDNIGGPMMRVSYGLLAPRGARDQHTRALAIARDISAAPEQARALEGLGRAHIQGGNHDKGLDCLRQALTIYQRIGAPGARRVQETLRHGLTATP
jgi:hypothetical protein